MNRIEQKKKKRLEKDYQHVNSNPIQNIWIEWPEVSNLHNAFSVVCGPEDTPYQHGFYAFDFDFSEGYPFIQPKVVYNSIGSSIPQLTKFKSKTQTKTPRIHPNLYKDGYVCLSIIGTWRGEGWSPCYNIQSISVELQSLLVENPITKEPSFEEETGYISKLYRVMVTHANIRVSVMGMLKSTPDKYISIRHKMIEYFLNHFDSYIKICDKYENHEWNKTTLVMKLYNWHEHINFNKLKQNLIKLKKELEPQLQDIQNSK